MSITHRIYPEQRLVISTWAGVFDDGNMLSRYVALYDNPLWQPGFDEIVDLRVANVERVSGPGLKNFINALSRYYTVQFRNAIVAPDDLPFGLARMYKAFCAESSENVMVFRDVASAVEWMGLNPELIDLDRDPDR
jgi:hypothetical protein